MQGQQPVWAALSGASKTFTQSQQFFVAAQALCQVRAPAGRSKKQHQKRRDVRHTRSISISVRPLDNVLEPCGELFWVVSRDISIRGIGLICNEPIDHQYVEIGLLDDSLTVVGIVRHNTSIGSSYPLYLVGLEFMDLPY